ncbi:MAG: ATP-binding cassette domain-containing protein [Bacteroidetes bacterium]|nr:MAG: ATP-binding cassette domain-containing protein [Bacteroidota bacterium]
MESNVIIKFDKVSIFQNENLILANVSLEVDKGEFVYLIGKTGSGKSSLLKTFYADLEVKNGNATVAGFDLRTLRTKEIPFLRRKLGIVFQDFQLLMDRSVAENLFFVMQATGWKNKKEMQRRMHEVLAKVNLETKANKMPHKLSGGEQQRVGIARALLNDPEIILADEPTGNLDPETSEGIIGLLFDISKTGSAILMATHNYTFFERFPARTLRCEDGNIRESN